MLPKDKMWDILQIKVRKILLYSLYSSYHELNARDSCFKIHIWYSKGLFVPNYKKIHQVELLAQNKSSINCLYLFQMHRRVTYMSESLHMVVQDLLLNFVPVINISKHASYQFRLREWNQIFVLHLKSRLNCSQMPQKHNKITTTQVSWAGWTILLHFSTFWGQFKISHTFLYMMFPITWATCDSTCIENVGFSNQQDWLSPVYSGRLQYICRNSFYTYTPLHWCTIRG